MRRSGCFSGHADTALPAISCPFVPDLVLPAHPRSQLRSPAQHACDFVRLRTRLALDIDTKRLKPALMRCSTRSSPWRATSSGNAAGADPGAGAVPQMLGNLARRGGERFEGRGDGLLLASGQLGKMSRSGRAARRRSSTTCRPSRSDPRPSPTGDPPGRDAGGPSCLRTSRSVIRPTVDGATSSAAARSSSVRSPEATDSIRY